MQQHFYERLEAAARARDTVANRIAACALHQKPIDPFDTVAYGACLDEVGDILDSMPDEIAAAVEGSPVRSRPVPVLSGKWTCEACGESARFESALELMSVDHPARVHFAGVFTPLPHLLITLDDAS